MKAIHLNKTGGLENFSLEEIDKPTIKPNEVLVQVHAFSVNPVDFKVRADDQLLTMIYGEQRPAILGWDISGIVVETGTDVQDLKIGDPVFGMVNFPGAGNAYAEFVASPADHLAKIPTGVTFDDAAVTTLAALTALQVLQDKVKKGDRVLIHAGSGGVGHFAIQIAKHLGAYVITTSSAKNKEFITYLGADEHIDYHTQKFQDVVTDINFVFDMFNGDILLNSVKAVKEGGTVMSIPSPEFSEEVQQLANSKNVHLGFHMVQSNGEDMQKLSNLLEKSEIKPHISQIFEFEMLPYAHLQLESGRTVGKVVVNIQ